MILFYLQVINDLIHYLTKNLIGDGIYDSLTNRDVMQAVWDTIYYEYSHINDIH